MSDLFATRPAPAKRSRPSAMSALVAEGKSLDYETPQPQRRNKDNAKIWDTLHLVGIVGCFVFIGLQLFTNFGGAMLSPAEVAAEERQRDQIERCVLVFWEIAEVLKGGDVPGESLRCAESGLPNIIARVDNDIIVRHPQPQLLGYSDIVVSRNNPIPVLSQ